MPRGKPAAKRGGNKGRDHVNPLHVAKPAVSELPSCLQIRVDKTGVPEILQSSFPEFRNMQPFFSGLEKIDPEFGGSFNAYNTCWLGTAPEKIVGVEHDSEGHGFYSKLLLSDGTSQPVFVKRIHLLDPLCAMEGEYVWPAEGALPAPSELWKSALGKINDPLNEAYVDTLYAALASKFIEHDISPHWCRSYGTFSARVEKYVYNITDEYASMRMKPWWRRNQRLGIFAVHKDGEQSEQFEQSEDSNKGFFTEGLSELDIGDIDVIQDDVMIDTVHVEHVKEEEEHIQSENTDGPVRLTEPKIRLSRMPKSPSESTSSNSSDNSDDSSEDEIEQYVEFSDFPVQVTLLERLEGTMDELLEDEDEEDTTMLETKEARWASWLFQVIAGLTTAQHLTGFVHNDLHTNNIMWSGTGRTHIYYRVHKNKETYYMAVPTYGRIMKIIDFGRASYTLPEPAGFFISDAFYPGNDAATQYNCEPFYDPEDGKKVEPNTSFDLSRLAISLLESLYPERPKAVTPTKIMSKEGSKMYTETVSGIYNMMWEWLTDDEGKNVLRSPNGEERYPDFDLYRALAADVHKAIPKKQIERSIFANYKILAKALPKDESVYDLHI